MPNPSNELLIELLEEEIANLTFLSECHRRRGVQSMDTELSRLHRQPADRIKDATKLNQALIEQLEDRI